MHWSGTIDLVGPLVARHEVSVTLSAVIRPGWHVYAISQPPGGPNRLDISMPDGQALRQQGEITGHAALTSFDSSFDIMTQFYEGAATFRAPVTVEKIPAPEAAAVLDVRFQTRSEHLCLPPATIHIPIRVHAPEEKRK